MDAEPLKSTSPHHDAANAAPAPAASATVTEEVSAHHDESAEETTPTATSGEFEPKAGDEVKAGSEGKGEDEEETESEFPLHPYDAHRSSYNPSFSCVGYGARTRVASG